MAFAGRLTSTKDFHDTIADAYNALSSKREAETAAIKERVSSQTAMKESGVFIYKDIERFVPPRVGPHLYGLIGGLPGPMLTESGKHCMIYNLILNLELKYNITFIVMMCLHFLMALIICHNLLFSCAITQALRMRGPLIMPRSCLV
jgi:hypothetical protein